MALLLSLVGCVCAEAAGFVHLPVIHSTNEQHFGKRAVEMGLAVRSDVAYYAQLNFGTPAQSQYVQLDTGSFELWINPECASLTSASDQAFCEAIGTFNTSASSTLEVTTTGEQLSYGIGAANITYVHDTIGMPGTSIALTDVQFGVATSTTQEFAGLLGIGYGQGYTTSYANFIDELADQNVTAVKAFSLALGSKAEQQGVIIFGGVDTQKFAGSLVGLPIIPADDSPDSVARYWIRMAGVAHAGTAYANSSHAVFVDSGSTLSLLPTDLAYAIAADFGADQADSNGYFTVDCSLANRTDAIDFLFAGVNISVSYNDLVRKSSATTCMLGIAADDDFALLGDTFLRSAYVVVDQVNNDIWMAPYVNCGSSPAALASADSLKSLTGACSVDQNDDSASSSTATTTASATPSATVASTASATSNAPSSSTSASSLAPACTPHLAPALLAALLAAVLSSL